MPIILQHNGQLQVIYPTGEVDELTLIPDEAQWFSISVENIPQTPVESWLVDWQAGTVNIDPAKLPPPPPDWDGLNLAIMADEAFNQAYATVMQSHPLIAAALPTALTQVASGQTAMFATAFVAMCAAAEVTPTQRAIWADIGATFNVPTEFLDIVRGV